MLNPPANEIQHGGVHYQKTEYQHWDWVTDVGLHYLLGCATKYATRWRDKGGALDLKKAIHYIDKADERGVHVLDMPARHVDLTIKFAAQLPEKEGRVVLLVMMDDYAGAKKLLHDLINDE